MQSIFRLSIELADEFEIYVVTGNTDVDGTQLNVNANTWLKREEGFDVIYLERQKQNAENFKQLLSEIDPDCYYINGMFSAKFSILPLRLLRTQNLLNSTVLAPRGMLGAGALKLKATKKSVFLWAFKLLRISKSIIWHSTSNEESLDIKRVFGDNSKIVEVPNFPRLLTAKKKQFNASSLRLFFYSRISEKKNLISALTALKHVKSKNVVFSIYGPIEDQHYWQQCEKIIAELPETVKVQYKGIVEPNNLTTVLAEEEVLLLPTLNENYGHAIVESLLCGCAAIISDQTPWSDIENFGAGTVTGVDDVRKIAAAVDKYAAMTIEEKQLFSTNAITYISNKVKVLEIKNSYISLFNGASQNRSK